MNHRRGETIYKDHAYIVSEALDHGMQVFDLTRVRGLTAPQTFSPTAVSTDFGSAHKVAIHENTGFAYVVGSDFPGCYGGLRMYDISPRQRPC